jgi:G:T/U-mismatch repair DNA glycosylase
MSMRTDHNRTKAEAMSNAQRQRRHRDKRRRELDGLRTAVANAPALHADERAHDQAQADALRRQVQQLTAQLQAARDTAAKHLARIDALQAQHATTQTADRQAVQALREAWLSVLVKLTPAARHVVRAHLHSCGAAQWLEPTAEARDTRPDSAPLGAHVFFNPSPTENHHD